MELGIDWPSDQQLQVAWGILDKLQPRQVLIIKDYAKNRPKLFQKAVEMYIDCYKSLEFNKDYSKVKRIK